MGYAPAVGRARVNRSSLPILFLAAKSSQDRCRVNLSREREKKKTATEIVCWTGKVGPRTASACAFFLYGRSCTYLIYLG